MTIPMPEPDIFDGTRLDGSIASHGYSAATLEAYADAKVREALELAAQTCENQGRATTTLDGESFYIALGQAARAIRALIPPLPGPVEPTT